MTATSHGPLRRRGVGLLAAAAGMVGAMGLTGCGIQSSGMKVVGAAPSLQAANDVTGTDAAGSGSNQYQLYFFRDGRLTPVVRYASSPVTQAVIMAALIKGPNSTDAADGFTSVIPGDLTVESYTAHDQQWNYQYSQALTGAEKAQIVCTIQANLNAPSVGTSTSENEFWNTCFDFAQDYGAPAYLANLDPSATATAEPTGSPG